MKGTEWWIKKEAPMVGPAFRDHAVETDAAEASCWGSVLLPMLLSAGADSCAGREAAADAMSSLGMMDQLLPCG